MNFSRFSVVLIALVPLAAQADFPVGSCRETALRAARAVFDANARGAGDQDSSGQPASVKMSSEKDGVETYEAIVGAQAYRIVAERGDVTAPCFRVHEVRAIYEKR